MARKFRILSIDGGGVRGILPCCVLRHIEELLCEKTHNANARIADYFDLIVGTSTGGIVAAGLLCPDERSPSKPKYTAEALLQIYMERSDDIFSIPVWHGIKSAAGLSDEKYPSNGIEEVLEDYFSDLMLSELIKPCLITSFDMKHWRPHFFRSHRAGEPGYDFLVRDALRATSAAPTYFEPARIKGSDGTVYPLVDGGLVANNPSVVAYSEARSLEVESTKDMVMLSLGTGGGKFSFSHAEISDWGPLAWIKPALNVMLDDGGVNDFCIIQMFASPPANSLRDYLRVEHVLPAANSDMDNAETENLIQLEELGKNTVRLYQHELESFTKLLLEVSNG